MAIFRLLQQSAFAPEDIKRIVTAYEHALKQLGLRGGVDPLTTRVAQSIIEVAQTGEKDPEAMCAAALSRMVEGARHPERTSPSHSRQAAGEHQ